MRTPNSRRELSFGSVIMTVATATLLFFFVSCINATSSSSPPNLSPPKVIAGVVTTLAGTGTLGAANGSGILASFNYPRGVAINGTNLYVADTSNHLIRQIQ